MYKSGGRIMVNMPNFSNQAGKGRKYPFDTIPGRGTLV